MNECVCPYERITVHVFTVIGVIVIFLLLLPYVVPCSKLMPQINLYFIPLSQFLA